MAKSTSSARSPMPTPSAVIWHADCGPVLRYERITAAQVRALDLLPEDDRTSGSIFPGVSIRRAPGRRFNVCMTADAIAIGNTAYARFRTQLLAAVSAGC